MIFFSFFDNFVMGSNEKLYEYNIFLLGDSYVGKTSIMEKIIDDKYNLNEKTIPTIGIKKGEIKNIVNKKKISFKLWDTAGSDQYNSIDFNYLKKSDFIILVYDITNIDSFKNLSFWMNQIKENKEDAKIILVGNKCDVSDKERKVEENELEKLIQEYKEKPEYKNIVFIKFLEVSVKNGKNIKVLWENILEKIEKESFNEVCSCCPCC